MKILPAVIIVAILSGCAPVKKVFDTVDTTIRKIIP